MHDPQITPTPSADEAAAITAALLLSWPSPAAAEPDATPSTTWRFSGRWWRKPSWRRP